MTRYPDLHPDDAEARATLLVTVKGLRVAVGLDRQTVADRLGITVNAVAQFETDDGCDPMTSTVQRVARACHHRLAFSLTGLPQLPDDGPTTTLIALANTACGADADGYHRSILLTRLTNVRRWLQIDQKVLGQRIERSDSAISLMERDLRGDSRISTFQRYARGLGGALTFDLKPVDPYTEGAQ